jgi:hypothetical protein
LQEVELAEKPVDGGDVQGDVVQSSQVEPYKHDANKQEPHEVDPVAARNAPKHVESEKKPSGLREVRLQSLRGTEARGRLKGFKRPNEKKKELQKAKRSKQIGCFLLILLIKI